MKPCVEDNTVELKGLEQPLRDLVAAQVTFGKALADLLSTGAGAAMGAARGLNLSMPRMKGCCDIPEACWMPKSLGEAKCTLAADGVGMIHLKIVNGDFRGREFSVEAAGPDAGLVTFSETSFFLGPKERRTVTATFTMPTERKDVDLLIWVRGCSDYYMRWTITSASASKACCYEVDVIDEPDYVDHWYDHFYCPKPCKGGAQREPSGNNPVRGVN